MTQRRQAAMRLVTDFVADFSYSTSGRGMSRRGPLSITFYGARGGLQMSLSFKAAFVLGLLIASVSAEAFAANEAPGKGPYSVGSTFLLEFDGTRRHQNGSARPVPIIAFYPVD